MLQQIKFNSEREYQKCLVHAIACMFDDYYTDEYFNSNVIQFDKDKYFCFYSDFRETEADRFAYAFKVRFFDEEAFLYDFEFASTYFNDDFNSMHECKKFDELNKFYDNKYVAHFTLNEVIELLCENYVLAHVNENENVVRVQNKTRFVMQHEQTLIVCVPVVDESTAEIFDYYVAFDLDTCNMSCTEFSNY